MSSVPSAIDSKTLSYDERQQMYEQVWNEGTPLSRAEVDLSFERTLDADFIKAASGKDPQQLENLLVQFPSYDINKDLQGYQTILIQAVRTGNPDMVQTALRWGADVDLPDKEGRTPLMHAAVHDKPQILEILLDNGADADRRIPVLGYTALHLASIAGASHAVDCLVHKGAETNYLTFDGKTAQQLAGNEKSFDAIRDYKDLISGTRMMLTLKQQIEDVRFLLPDLQRQMSDWRARNGQPRLDDTGLKM